MVLCDMQTALKVECAKLFCLDVRREVPVSLHDGSYDHEEYSPYSLSGDGSNIHISLTKYQDWGSQHSEMVASLLENC